MILLRNNFKKNVCPDIILFYGRHQTEAHKDMTLLLTIKMPIKIAANDILKKM